MQIIHRSDCGKKRFVARGKLQFTRDEPLMVAEHPFESMPESYHFPLLKINPNIFHVRPNVIECLAGVNYGIVDPGPFARHTFQHDLLLVPFSISLGEVLSHTVDEF